MGCRALKMLSWLVALTLLSSRATAEDDFHFPGSKSDDGRFGTACTRDGFDKPVCFVPFARLIALPERYDGKLISVTGFLKEWHGISMLFPSRESFESDAPLEHVYVGDVPSNIGKQVQHGIWVQIVGKFDAKFEGQALSLGAIWHPSDVRPMQDSQEPPEVRLVRPPSLPKASLPKWTTK